MNIVLYVNSFLPRVGGRELVVKHLATALMRLGHQVRVIGPGAYFKNRHYLFEYPVYRLPSIASLKLWRECLKEDGTIKSPGARVLLEEKLQKWQVRHNLAKWGYDIVHAHNTYPTGYAAAQLKDRMKIPLVITPHGQDIHKIEELGHGLRLNPHLDKRIRFTLEKADAATAISESIKDSLHEAGAAKEKIHFIPNGVDLERFSDKIDVDIRKWLKVAADARLLVSVGNYHPRKGHELLVKAMPAILKGEPRARMVIVGRMTEALLPLIKELNVSDKVILTGAIPVPGCLHKDAKKQRNENADYLAALLQSSEMYISSSTDEGAEGLSLALLEGMAASLPIIATDISGNRDVIAEGGNGLLVEPKSEGALASAILALLSDEQKRKRLGQGALDLARQYGWDKIATQYLELYQGIIDTYKRQ